MMKTRDKRLLVGAALAALLLSAWMLHHDATTAANEQDKALQVVMLGSQNETLDYGRAQTYFPSAVVSNVCDVLVGWRQGRLRYQLASAIDATPDAKRWTVRLRPGVRFSDGSPLLAEDAFASLHFLAQSLGFGTLFEDIDFNASQVNDDLSFTLQLRHARADFVASVLAAASVVWKEGKGNDPLLRCSGPWQVSEFSASQGAILTRNPYAWQPAVFFKQIIIRPLMDPTARVNALLSGAADFAFDIPVSSARSLQKHKRISLLHSGVTGASAFYFAMNTRLPPFDDVQIRRAMKALVDRQQLVDVVLEGYGYPGHDLFGQGLPGDNAFAWPIKHDLAAARQLFQKKGVTALTLLTADLTPGLNNAAELLRQQLAEAGVQLRVVQVNPADYLSDIPRLHQAQMLSLFALNRPFVAALPVLYGRDNPYNYGGWYPPSVALRVEQLRRTTDPAGQQILAQQLQAQIITDGPYVVWGYRDQISASVVELQGVELNQGVPLFGAAHLSAPLQQHEH